MYRKSLTLVALVVIFCWSSRACQAQGKDANVSTTPTKLPPLPKGAEPVPTLGDLGWPQRAEGAGFKPPTGQPPMVVIRVKEELLKAWVADGGSKNTPPRWLPHDAKDDESKAREVDFAKEMVVGVFWRDMTDRHSIHIERVSRQGDKVVVEYRKHTLQRGGAKPRSRDAAHVVVLPRMIEVVEFRELPPSVTVDKRLIP